MGGTGSGRPSGGGRHKTNSFDELNVLTLRRAGCLTNGWAGGWRWSFSDGHKNWIQMRTLGDVVLLDYRTRFYGEDWRDVSQAVRIVHQPCRYGGSRPYFLCPGSRNGRPCEKRVTKLYSTNIFHCRQCARLTYPSQNEGYLDRALRRADKIRARLGGQLGLDAIFPRRPRYMRRTTYDRLRQEVFRIDDAVNALIDARMGRAFSPGRGGGRL